LKLIIQIPCYNEAQTIALVLSSLPKKVVGFDSVDWLIIDDGSRDDTVQVAIKNGVNHIVCHNVNKGLAQTFMTGINAALDLGADVIVNIDADNQYDASDIPVLVLPILEKRAEIVVGARPIDAIKDFSNIKKWLQKLGSWVVRIVSRTDIPDAPSGFRAFSRDAAMRLMVFNDYTYTLETIIQAGQKNIAITSVPIKVNPNLRPSRLVKGNFSYIWQSLQTIFRIFIVYRPLRFFGAMGILLLATGFLIGGRFLYFLSIGDGDGHIQSLILAAILLVIGFQSILVAFVADLISANRKLLEGIRFSVSSLPDKVKKTLSRVD
jgi:glycosyltransferase involved in cell wall biosynthesis